MKMIVMGSICLSIFASILFYAQHLGISVVLFVTATLLALFYFLEQRKKIKNRKAYFLAIPILLLASTYFIYNQTFFKVTNMIAILSLTAMMLIWALSEKGETKYLVKRIFTCIFAPLEHVSEAMKGITKTLFAKKQREKKVNEHTKQIWTGIAISLPLLLIVLILLSSADMIFAQGIQNIADGLSEGLDKIFENHFLGNLLARMILILITTIYMVSFILNLWNKKLFTMPENEKQAKISMERTVSNTVVSILNIVYAIFCAIQITTLFAKITPENFNYAEYARQGFFQLMIISAINFAIILVTTKNEKQGAKGQIFYAKGMNILMTIFTMIILLSAFTRMNLYQQEYGYTYLRIFVDFALVTEAFLLIPTLVYIVKPSFHPVKSYLIIVITMYVVMNFSNIGNFIAKENVNRYLQSGKRIDFEYLTNTRTDGLEQVIRLYQNEQEETKLKRDIKRYFQTLEDELQEDTNWQEWNVSKWKAKSLLEKIEK